MSIFIKLILLIRNQVREHIPLSIVTHYVRKNVKILKITRSRRNSYLFFYKPITDKRINSGDCLTFLSEERKRNVVFRLYTVA